MPWWPGGPTGWFFLGSQNEPFWLIWAQCKSRIPWYFVIFSGNNGPMLTNSSTFFHWYLQETIFTLVSIHSLLVFSQNGPKLFSHLACRTLYAEVANFWGCVVRLSTTMRLPNQEIKHWRCFWRFCVTFIVDSENQNNSTKAQSSRFSKYMFLLQGAACNSRLQCGHVNKWAFFS